MNLRPLVACAPLIFILHVIEEAPGFVAWLNAHVEPDITNRSFLQVNLTALIITVVVSAVVWLGVSSVTATVAVAWLGFLFAANAVLHIGGAVVDRGYVPGVITSVVLYLPYFALVFRGAMRAGVSPWALLAASGAASIPMLVHGYRIVFLGSRLF